MKRILLLFAILVTGLHGTGARAEPLICQDPVKSVCDWKPSVRQWTTEQIRDEAAAKSRPQPATSPGSPTSDDDTLKKYASQVKNIYKVLLPKLAKIGISEAAIQSKVAQIQRDVAANMRQGRVGSSPDADPAHTDSKDADKIAAVRFVFYPKDKHDVEMMYVECGSNGLISGSFFDSATKRFYICPGRFVDVLNSGALYGMGSDVSHELSHSVDAWNGSMTRYQGYVQCVASQNPEAFGSLKGTIEHLGKRSQPLLSQRIDQLRADPVANASELAKNEVLKGWIDNRKSNLIAEWDMMIAKLNRYPTVAETHAGELTADLGDYTELLSELRQIPPDQREVAVAMRYRDYCESPQRDELRKLLGTSGSDGLHPKPKFRIAHPLEHPEVRLLLGCQSLSGSRPWCSPSEKEPISARCTRDTGAQSSADCEEMMASELQHAGCQQLRIECEPFGSRGSNCAGTAAGCQMPTLNPISGQWGCYSSAETFVRTEPPQSLKTLDSCLPGVCLLPAQGVTGTPPQAPGAAARANQ